MIAGFFFLFFFLSGFCGLVYQLVWLRLAMADFGVVTPLVSIVLSVFMAGLALGSWGGGRLVRRFGHRSGGFFIGLYGASELAIGISGLVVAPLLGLGRTFLAAAHGNAAWGSLGYYLASAGCVAIVMLPFCVCMGATFPLAMAGIRTSRSFSYLYVANVAGALAGALCTAFVLIELIGFSQTLHVAAALNMLVAVLAFTVAKRSRRSASPATSEPSIRTLGSPDPDHPSTPIRHGSVESRVWKLSGHGSSFLFWDRWFTLSRQYWPCTSPQRLWAHDITAETISEMKEREPL